jgi:hypothetical protein
MLFTMRMLLHLIRTRRSAHGIPKLVFNCSLRVDGTSEKFTQVCDSHLAARRRCGWYESVILIRAIRVASVTENLVSRKVEPDQTQVSLTCSHSRLHSSSAKQNLAPSRFTIFMSFPRHTLALARSMEKKCILSSFCLIESRDIPAVASRR